MDFISIDEIRVGDEVGVVRPLPNGSMGISLLCFIL